MKINLKKIKSIDGYDTAEWESNGKSVSLTFPDEIHAVHAENISRIVVEKYFLNKIGFYKMDGELDFDADIPNLDGYMFRGINRNLSSKSGASLLFYPLDSSKGNQWGDIEQYELIHAPHCLGKYLDIYR